MSSTFSKGLVILMLMAGCGNDGEKRNYNYSNKCWLFDTDCPPPLKPFYVTEKHCFPASSKDGRNVLCAYTILDANGNEFKFSDAIEVYSLGDSIQ